MNEKSSIESLVDGSVKTTVTIVPEKALSSEDLPAQIVDAERLRQRILQQEDELAEGHEPSDPVTDEEIIAAIEELNRMRGRSAIPGAKKTAKLPDTIEGLLGI